MPRFIPYRRNLKTRSQSLRRDPTPAERKLWFEFLRDLPVKFTRQASRLLVIELDGDSHYTDQGERYDERRTADLAALGIRVIRVTNAQVMQMFEGVCAKILEALNP